MAKVEKRLVIAGAVGNALEWYDFAVFGFFATAISAQFFPSDDPLAGLVNTFGVFAAGYLVRPLGGVLFGHIGDRLGRKRALQISIVAMAIPTSLMAVLPTHEDLGVMAAVLLVVLRLAQGFSVGGEFIGSICYLVEVAPKNRRGLYGSGAVFSAVGGMLLGSAVAATLNAVLSDQAILDWGWRLPFLGGLLIGTFGWWMRARIDETPEFLKLMEAGGGSAGPLVEALRLMPLRVVHVGAIVILLGVAIYTLFIWMPTYLTHIVEPPIPHALLINTCAMVVLIVMMPIAGLAADRWSYKTVLAGASLGLAIVVYPLFAWIDTAVIFAVIVAQIIFALLNGAIQGPMPFAMVSMFPVQIRYSAMALGYNTTLAIFGGTAPLVATWLIKETGNLAAPAWYLAVIAVVTAVATLLLRPGVYQRTTTS